MPATSWPGIGIRSTMRLPRSIWHDVGRPGLDAERLLQLVHLREHQLHVRQVREALVTRRVIAVRVRVRDDQLRRRRSGCSASATWRSRSITTGAVSIGAGAGVLEQRLVAAEDQIEERLLVVDAARLPQDEEVRVVLVHLERRAAPCTSVRRSSTTSAARPARRTRWRLRRNRRRRRLRAERRDRQQAKR